MKKKILISLLAVFLTALAGAAFYLNSLLPIITGYAAKNLASAVFVSGRSQAGVEALDLNFSFIRYTRNRVDTAGKTVVSRFLWGSSTAIYREGLGCTLLRGDTETELRGFSYPASAAKAVSRDTLDWPMGNRLADTLVPGIDTKKLNEIAVGLVDKGAYNGHAFAFVVLYHGVQVAERYQQGIGPDTRLLSWSMAKSFTNTLAGIMVKDHGWDINQPAGLPEWQNDDRRSITANHLLQMQSGLEWNEDYGNRSDVTLMLHDEADFAAFAASKPLAHQPGTHWYYSSGSTNVVCRLIRNALNSDEACYRLVREELFARTGMNGAVFETDASGTPVGSSYVYATARDFARFALLYLQDGVFAGERILPEGWVNYTTTPASGSKAGYGSSFWLNRGKEFSNLPETMFYCKGHDGQRIFMLPEQQLAVVVLGYSPKPDNIMDFGRLMDDVVRTIL